MSGHILWAQAQSCAECGAERAYLRAGHGEAICCVCGHENPMDGWNLDDGEVFMWASTVVPNRTPAALPGRVLYVVAYDMAEV